MRCTHAHELVRLAMIRDDLFSHPVSDERTADLQSIEYAIELTMAAVRHCAIGNSDTDQR